MSQSRPLTTGRRELLRVLVLAMLGYGFLFAVLVIQTFLIAVMVKVAASGNVDLLTRVLCGIASVILFTGVYYIFTGVLLRPHRFEGYEISPESPLYKEMEGLSRTIGSPVPSKCFVSCEFNASAGVEHGFLPWRNRPYVTIGAPLAAALSTDELRAVMAHELGHHSHKHSRMSNWIYRVRRSWDGMEDAFDALPRALQFIVDRFYDWFIPKFQRSSFAVARANEYEADAAAAAAVGPHHLASALCRLEAAADWLEQHYWPSLYRHAGIKPRPPRNAVSLLARRLERFDESAWETSFAGVDGRATDEFDTHPSLRDRVTALGQKVAPPSRVQECALELLGDQLSDALAALDLEWLEASEFDWEERYEYRRRLEEISSTYGSALESGSLSLDELHALAEVESQLGNARNAFRCRKLIYRARPTSENLAQCVYELHRIPGHEPRVRKLLRQCADLNHPEADEVLYSVGMDLAANDDERTRWAERGQQAEDALELRYGEIIKTFRIILASVDWPRKLYPPNLPEADMERIRNLCETSEGVFHAFLARVEIDDAYPDCPHHVLFVNGLFDEEEEEAFEQDLWVSTGTLTIESWMEAKVTATLGYRHGVRLV